MKKDKLIYWISTAVGCAVMVFSIVKFVFNDHFPFPNGPDGRSAGALPGSRTAARLILHCD